MRICVILEGCYPYVTGGVSSWIHEYIQAMPEHEFVIFAIGDNSSKRGKFKYTLPSNVVEVKEFFLGDALKLQYLPQEYSFSEDETDAIYKLLNCNKPDWEKLFSMYNKKKINPLAFLHSENFLNELTKLSENEYPYTAFADLFHTVRSMMLPVLFLLSEEIPKADVYHSIATGYSGLFARMGSYTYNVPYIITEHGIYTREREEEIIRAKWINPVFKKFWIKFFYMLSDAAYSKATKVTSLFAGAMNTQIDMGCDADKCSYIGNGVHYERFCNIPPKENNGYYDIGAVLRIAPIKDVKTMLYAFSDCKRRVPNARLFIAGPEDDKEYAQECYNLVEQLELEDVKFLGTINVVDWLGKFDFTILSSISEGMPLSVLESFSAGVPVVTTDVGSCRELLFKVADDDEFGPAGYCVAPMRPQAMSDAMVKMCLKEDVRKEMAIAGKKRVEKYFLHPDMINKYHAVYDEVFKIWRG